MKKRYTEEQILGVLKEAVSGKAVAQVLREQGVSPQTYYRWKRKYGGLEPSQLSRLRACKRFLDRAKSVAHHQDVCPPGEYIQYSCRVKWLSILPSLHHLPGPTIGLE